jgi:hypothetical protein
MEATPIVTLDHQASSREETHLRHTQLAFVVVSVSVLVIKNAAE